LRVISVMWWIPATIVMLREMRAASAHLHLSQKYVLFQRHAKRPQRSLEA
jgi:hypothetical protein